MFLKILRLWSFVLIIHESMPAEAAYIGNIVRNELKIPVQRSSLNLDAIFQPTRNFPGYFQSVGNLLDAFQHLSEHAIMILTNRDVYARDDSQDDDWVLGYHVGNISVVAGARMKRPDNKPSAVLQVPAEQYLARIAHVAIHEIGHEIVEGPHFELASWVNARTGVRLPLGRHCIDNTCVMYEGVDIVTPPADEGYLLLGDEKRFDAGFDELIARRRAGRRRAFPLWQRAAQASAQNCPCRYAGPRIPPPSCCRGAEEAFIPAWS
jgi:predicted Zn-dependent protease